MRRGMKRFGQLMRGFDGLPAGLAMGLVRGDARGHLVVPRLGRGDVDPRLRQSGDEAFGVTALAGARAAEDEGRAFVPGCGRLRHHYAAWMKRPRKNPASPPSSTQKSSAVITTATTKLWCKPSGIGLS